MVGELDDVAGAGVELATMAGSLVFVGPGHGILPDLGGAPGVVTHDDNGRGVPLILLFEELTDVCQITVSEGEVVDVGGVFGAEDLLVAIVETVRMGDREMQEQEVDRGVGEICVTGGAETAIVAEVLADIAGFVGGGAGTATEEMLCIEPEVAKGADKVDCERTVWR